MRSKLTTAILACGLLAALAAPSLACSFSTQASSDTQQQTAQVQQQSDTRTQ